MIEQGIIQKKAGGSLSSAVLHGKNTVFLAGYIGLSSGSRGRVGIEEVDVRVEENQLGKNQNNQWS